MEEKINFYKDLFNQPIGKIFKTISTVEEHATLNLCMLGVPVEQAVEVIEIAKNKINGVKWDGISHTSLDIGSLMIRIREIGYNYLKERNINVWYKALLKA